MASKSWFVYIIQTEQGFLYTGITTDLERRFKEHSNSKRGAKYFRGKVPVQLVFTRIFPSRSEASRFEAAVKKMNRTRKLQLISEGISRG